MVGGLLYGFMGGWCGFTVLKRERRCAPETNLIYYLLPITKNMNITTINLKLNFYAYLFYGVISSADCR